MQASTDRLAPGVWRGPKLSDGRCHCLKRSASRPDGCRWPQRARSRNCSRTDVRDAAKISLTSTTDRACRDLRRRVRRRSGECSAESKDGEAAHDKFPASSPERRHQEMVALYASRPKMPSPAPCFGHGAEVLVQTTSAGANSGERDDSQWPAPRHAALGMQCLMFAPTLGARSAAAQFLSNS